MATSDVDQNKGMAILAYFIFFLPLILAPNSQFAKYHVNQGLILLIAWIVIWVFGVFMPVIGWIIWPFATLAWLILWIMGIVNAAKGEAKPVPLIGKYTIIK